MENNLENAARLIGASVHEMKRFPENIRISISSVISDLDKYGDSYKPEAFAKVNEYWVKGNIECSMTTISAVTGIPEETIRNLPEHIKKQLYYEYSMDHSDTETFYATIQNCLSVSELGNIAELLDIPLSRLEKLPKDIQTELSGIYAMEYGEDSLADSLRSVLAEWL